MSNRDGRRERAERRVGETLEDKWRLEKLLGLGGMAAVYAAAPEDGGARVAVKVLHKDSADDSEEVRRFLREAAVLSRIEHPGVLQVTDAGMTQDGAAFLVMQLLDGESLDERLERTGNRLPVDEVLDLGAQLLEVLAAAHESGVLHRDIKPANLFLTREGSLKVLDFGIARIRELSLSTSARTHSGTLMGTPAFMAPEQARARWDQVDERTDVWAVGATLFVLLSGVTVHEAETANELLGLAMTAESRSLRAVSPELPREVIALVDRSLRYRRHERWDGALAMRDALRVVQDELFGDAPTATTSQKQAGGSNVPRRRRSSSSVSTLRLSSKAPRPESSETDPRGGRRWVWAAVVLPVLAGALVWSLSGPKTSAPATGSRPAEPLVETPKPENSLRAPAPPKAAQASQTASAQPPAAPPKRDTSDKAHSMPSSPLPAASIRAADPLDRRKLGINEAADASTRAPLDRRQ